MTKDGSWAGSRKGLATLWLSQSQPWGSAKCSWALAPASPRDTLWRTQFCKSSNRWCALIHKVTVLCREGKGLQKVAKLEQFSTPYVLKYFWGNRQKCWGIPEEEILFYRSLFLFLPMWIPLTCLLYLHQDLYLILFSSRTHKSQFHNAVFLPHLCSVLALRHSEISEPPTAKHDLQYTSPICSWLESTLVHLSFPLSIKIKKEPYLYIRQWSISNFFFLSLSFQQLSLIFHSHSQPAEMFLVWHWIQCVGGGTPCLDSMGQSSSFYWASACVAQIRLLIIMAPILFIWSSISLTWD